jgi:hypothetical protein
MAIWMLAGAIVACGFASTAEAVDGPYFARSQYGPYGYYHAQAYLSTPNTPPYFALHPPIYYGRGIQPAYSLSPYYVGIYGSRTDCYYWAGRDLGDAWGPQPLLAAAGSAEPRLAPAPRPAPAPAAELIILNPYAMKTEADKAAAWESLPVKPKIVYPAEEAKRSP